MSAPQQGKQWASSRPDEGPGTLVSVGLDFRTADVAVRERHAVPAELAGDVCRDFVRSGVFTEAAVVSTCNRVEAYLVAPPGTDPADAAHMASRSIGPGPDACRIRIGLPAAHHLFRVASSLDSMVLGEPQILGQVKEAFAAARSAGTVGTLLAAVFQRAFRAAKRVRTETGIARSAVSVGYVSVELAKTIFGELEDVEVLLVGAGNMAVLAAQNLADSGARRVKVLNRTEARAEAVAGPHGWTSGPFCDLEPSLSTADVVICSTGARGHVLTPDIVSRAVRHRRGGPLFLIDIAVPRDIDPACAELPDVYLYDVDDLEQQSRTNTAGRQEAACEAERIVEQELSDLARWVEERHAVPTIRQLRERAMDTARLEASRTIRMLPGADEHTAGVVRMLAEAVANRLVRNAVLALKQSAGSPDGRALEARVQELFELRAPAARASMR